MPCIWLNSIGSFLLLFSSLSCDYISTSMIFLLQINNTEIIIILPLEWSTIHGFKFYLFVFCFKWLHFFSWWFCLLLLIICFYACVYNWLLQVIHDVCVWNFLGIVFIFQNIRSWYSKKYFFSWDFFSCWF